MYMYVYRRIYIYVMYMNIYIYAGICMYILVYVCELMVGIDVSIPVMLDGF